MLNRQRVKILQFLYNDDGDILFSMPVRVRTGIL